MKPKPPSPDKTVPDVEAKLPKNTPPEPSKIEGTEDLAPQVHHTVRPWLGRVISLVLFLLIVAAIIVVVVKHDELVDWVKTRGYHPNVAVEKLVTDTDMTRYGKRLFYVNHPAVEDRTEFNKHCTDAFEQVAVLGCYTGNRRGIYLYNVTDQRLYGIQQVTAAHEMLHQAYDRLSDKDRQHVNELLEAYAKTITDKDLQSKIDTYRKTEPGDVDNEMHSVFGTEVEKLPAELETYYRQYFTDRKKVISFHTQYQTAFSQRTEQIAAYDAQLESIKTQVESLKQDVTSRESALTAQRAEMNSLLAAGNAKAYNAMVGPYNTAVGQYKTQVTTVNNLIDQYNQTVDARNKIAVEEQDLLRAEDSHASSVNQQ